MTKAKRSDSLPDDSPPIISLVGDPRLNILYGPKYSREAEEREKFISDLERQSVEGGRGRCWRCGAVAVHFARLRTPLGPFGLAECETCRSWCVL